MDAKVVIWISLLPILKLTRLKKHQIMGMKQLMVHAGMMKKKEILRLKDSKMFPLTILLRLKQLSQLAQFL